MANRLCPSLQAASRPRVILYGTARQQRSRRPVRIMLPAHASYAIRRRNLHSGGITQEITNLVILTLNTSVRYLPT